MLVRSALYRIFFKNGVGLGWKSRVRNSVTCRFMMMVFDDKCTVQACCCFLQETGSCCTPCKSHATLRLIGPACCAWPGLCKRSSTSSGLLLQSHTCKKWVEKVRTWRRQAMSHFQDANASKVRLWCWTGWLSPFANTRCHLPTGEKDTIYLLPALKSGDVAHPSLPALISAPGQLTRAHHLMS